MFGINKVLYIILAIILGYVVKSRIIEKRSIKSKFVELILPFALRAKKNESYKDLKMFISEPRVDKYSIPDYIKTESSIKEDTFEELRYYRMNSKGKNENKVFYIHGGAYVCEMMDQHIMMLDKIASSLDTEIIIPIYLLAPEHNYKESYKEVVSLYRSMISQYEAKNLILMGDSAGGGYALGLSMYLRNHGIRQPRELILLSPWVDITMSNPSITAKLSRGDKILDLHSLIDCGSEWAGESNPKDYLLSPIYGDFIGLPRITSFVGTSEIFFPDCQRLHKKLSEEKVENTLRKYNKMQHVFPALPIPEAEESIREIVNIIGNHAEDPIL